MAQKVIWTSQAEEDYRSMQDYLLDAWSDEIAERFATEVLERSTPSKQCLSLEGRRVIYRQYANFWRNRTA